MLSCKSAGNRCYNRWATCGFNAAKVEFFFGIPLNKSVYFDKWLHFHSFCSLGYVQWSFLKHNISIKEKSDWRRNILKQRCCYQINVVTLDGFSYSLSFKNHSLCHVERSEAESKHFPNISHVHSEISWLRSGWQGKWILNRLLWINLRR